jgi:microcystin-dependent protein
MADPFMGEIRMASFTNSVQGWADCNGQFLPINQNQALFSLLGTTFGGNGQTTFALPDYRDRVPMHAGNGHTLGEKGGEESHTLTLTELPTHLHQVMAVNSVATLASANTTGSMLAQSSGSQLYHPATSLQAMDPRTSSVVGGSQPHTNLMPFSVIRFMIALQGIFPTQS